MPIKIPEREYRSFGEYAAREQDETGLVVSGTPVVFDTPTCLFEEDGVKYYELIARGALDGADMSDFIFNLNHELTPFARSKNGSLRYTLGDDALTIEATLDGSDERHKQLYNDIKSGRIDKMSFSFTVAEASYDHTTRTRKILRIKKLFDVSAVTFPAYEQTSISARSFFAAEHEKERLAERERRARYLILKTKI